MLVGEFGWRLAIHGYAATAVAGATIFWLFYRPTADDVKSAIGPTVHGAAGRSAFVSPVVWMLAPVVGLGGFGQFTVTYFVPSVAGALYGLDAAAAGVIISTGYLTAIVVNLGVGLLADRFNKLVVLGLVFIILTVASASPAIENLLILRVATATVTLQCSTG